MGVRAPFLAFPPFLLFPAGDIRTPDPSSRRAAKNSFNFVGTVFESFCLRAGSFLQAFAAFLLLLLFEDVPRCTSLILVAIDVCHNLHAICAVQQPNTFPFFSSLPSACSIQRQNCSKIFLSPSSAAVQYLSLPFLPVRSVDLSAFYSTQHSFLWDTNAFFF